jgi:large subunit ribosomal protein L31
MKQNIHPQYFQAKVTCACGNAFVVGSTMQEIKVEICNKCHPFFTGTQKFIDTAGRVDRFKARAERAELKKMTPIRPTVSIEPVETVEKPNKAKKTKED